MKQNIQCPHCGWSGHAESEDMGGAAECPECGKEFVLKASSSRAAGARSQASLNPRINVAEIPQRIRDVLWDAEDVVYSSRPAHSALVLSMIASGIVWGIIGLSFFFVGILVTLPLALVVTYFSWKNRYYIITKERTIVSQGIFNVGIKIIFNRHIQLIAINTGIIDRWIGLNTVEVSTAAQGGAGGIMASFPGLSKGAVQLKSVNVKDVIGCYDQLRES